MSKPLDALSEHKRGTGSIVADSERMLVALNASSGLLYVHDLQRGGSHLLPRFSSVAREGGAPLVRLMPRRLQCEIGIIGSLWFVGQVPNPTRRILEQRPLSGVHKELLVLCKKHESNDLEGLREAFFKTSRGINITNNGVGMGLALLRFPAMRNR
jgi:hypothetical protein